MRNRNSVSECRIINVNSPGGAARHFQVEYRRPVEFNWQPADRFPSYPLAVDACHRLQLLNYHTRIVIVRNSVQLARWAG